MGKIIIFLLTICLEVNAHIEPSLDSSKNLLIFTKVTVNGKVKTRKIPNITFFDNPKLTGKPILELKDDGLYKSKIKLCKKIYSKYRDIKIEKIIGIDEEEKGSRDIDSCYFEMIGTIDISDAIHIAPFFGVLNWLKFDRKVSTDTFELTHNGINFYFSLDKDEYGQVSPSNKNSWESFVNNEPIRKKQIEELKKCFDQEDDKCLEKFNDSANHFQNIKKFNRELSRFEQGRKRIERLSHGTLDSFEIILKYKGIKNRFDIYKKCFTHEMQHYFTSYFEHGRHGKGPKGVYSVGKKINYLGLYSEFRDFNKKNPEIRPGLKLICEFKFDENNKLIMLAPTLYR